jgi:hypothetical protein
MSRRAVVLALGVLASAAALVAVLLVVANREDGAPGPGDDRPALTSAQYRGRLAEAFAPVDLVGSPTDVSGLRRRARQFHGLVDDLGDVTPPPAAADMHARLVHGADGYAALLDRYADSGADGLATFEQHLTDGSSGASEIEWERAFNELISAGYVSFGPH